MKRSCGIVMPIYALPSPYGIGTLGQAAYDFVDFLAQSGQSWWQMLPVGPTSYGDSPYQSFSAYAGNPYFVDLEFLCRDGLLTAQDIDGLDWGKEPTRVNYGAIYQHRFQILKKAMETGWNRDADKISAFVEENRHWLPDYALFMALKRHFGMQSWTQWEDEDIRLRRPEAVERYRAALDEDIRLFTYIQYLFFQQWDALRGYAKKNGIGIIGDMPIYVAMDSADVWAEPKCFQLDEGNVPAEVAGVPPDFFSEDGQLWGNPLYDWEGMKADGYRWWMRRVEGASKLYDVIRIDHFRGFESYWAVPYGETSAKNGRWVKGPGMDLVGKLTKEFPQIQFIAEDLGYLTQEVRQLVADSGLPGMKILEFAFDCREPGNYFPHTYLPNSVCYTGTHDNAPIMAWKEEAAPEDIHTAIQYLGLGEEEGFQWGMLRGGLSCVSDLFLAQMQDYLGLGMDSRTNTPGRLGNNWQWRMEQGQITPELIQKMAQTVRLYGRDGSEG
jgi:4-alpha-glucanotransferase